MTAEQQAQEILDRLRPLVDAEIANLLGARPDLPLYTMVRYHLGYADPEGRPVAASGGKRIRSVLCLLACQAAGGDPARAAPAAAAIELAHSFTLLHDDIADQDQTRRGRPTVWTLWGVGQAITAGDALYALANLAMHGLAGKVQPAALAAALQELDQAVLAVCEGQHLDIAYEGRDDLDYPDYLKMVSLKTGALFRAACGIGAQIAGAEPEQVAALREFGSALGLVYQIRDDVLGTWGDPRELGKPVGSDLRRNKRTLPIILTLSTPEPALHERLLAKLQGGITDDEEAAAFAAAMEGDGIRAQCERMAGLLLRGALDEHLPKANLPPGADRDLRVIARYLAERTR